jgi:hypothetical protein
MQLYLSPLALSYLAQLLLTLCIAFYLAHLHIWRTGQSGTENRLPRQRDRHARLLACFFATLAGFIFTLFMEAVLLPTQRLYAVFVQNVLLGAALVCLLQFAYHFPQPSTSLRRETRLALALSVLYTLGEAGYALFRFFQLRGGVIEYRPNWSDYCLLLLFLWIPVALVRQIGALREHEGGWWARCREASAGQDRRWSRWPRCRWTVGRKGFFRIICWNFVTTCTGCLFPWPG